MTEKLLHIVLGLSGFLLLSIIQAYVINGIKEAMNEGHILFWFSKFIEKNVKSETIRKPLGKCIRCMASTGGAITYWPFVLFVFGWHWAEVPIFVANMFVLVVLNWLIFKKI